ncbi:MAG: hypothetical protein AAFQ43_11960, partial [Bacteroidota bacterium]
ASRDREWAEGAREGAQAYQRDVPGGEWPVGILDGTSALGDAPEANSERSATGDWLTPTGS